MKRQFKQDRATGKYTYCPKGYKHIYYKSTQLLDEFAKRENVHIMIDYTAKCYVSILQLNHKKEHSIIFLSLSLINDYYQLATILESFALRLGSTGYIKEYANMLANTPQATAPKINTTVEQDETIDDLDFADLGELDDLTDSQELQLK